MTQPATTPLIARIEVRDLFGEYDYDLIPVSDSDQSLPLMILYGNNGAGKTTLLHLIFHLLSSEPYGGHRTHLGSVIFSRLSVYLSGGFEITAQRRQPDTDGAYRLTEVPPVSVPGVMRV
jgi:predicted ATPase